MGEIIREYDWWNHRHIGPFTWAYIFASFRRDPLCICTGLRVALDLTWPRTRSRYGSWPTARHWSGGGLVLHCGGCGDWNVLIDPGVKATCRQCGAVGLFS